jgi:hypothetical protein
MIEALGCFQGETYGHQQSVCGDEQATGVDKSTGRVVAAGSVRPLIFGDPGELWLNSSARSTGWPDDSPYELLDFIGRDPPVPGKMDRASCSPGGVVCQEPYQAGLAERCSKPDAHGAEARSSPNLPYGGRPNEVYASPEPDRPQRLDYRTNSQWLASPPSGEAHYLPVLIRFHQVGKREEEDLNNYQVQGRLAPISWNKFRE